MLIGAFESLKWHRKESAQFADLLGRIHEIAEAMAVCATLAGFLAFVALSNSCCARSMSCSAIFISSSSAWPRRWSAYQRFADKREAVLRFVFGCLATTA